MSPQRHPGKGSFSEKEEEVVVCCAGVQSALEQELLDNAFAGACSVHGLVPPDAGVRDKGKTQIEHVICVDVRRRELCPRPHARPEPACVLVLEHLHPVVDTMLHLVSLLDRENGCQRALRGAAYVLVSRVVVSPICWSSEALDVICIDEAEPQLTVRAPELIDQDLSLDESTKTSWKGQLFGKKLVTGYYAYSLRQHCEK